MNREHYARVFTPEVYPRLLEATEDLSWMLSRGYTTTASLKMVGDRYKLNKTLREAVKRSGCSLRSHQLRGARRVDEIALRGSAVWIDGFNLLITIERALRGDPVLICQDGVIRDIAGVHGTYRRGRHTLTAFELMYLTLEALGVSQVKWFFDRPVSNSGRVAELARGFGDAEVVNDPDQDLINAPDDVIVISGDGLILERCTGWYNLGRVALTSLRIHPRGGMTMPIQHHREARHEWASVISSGGDAHESTWFIDLSRPPTVPRAELG